MNKWAELIFLANCVPVNTVRRTINLNYSLVYSRQNGMRSVNNEINNVKSYEIHSNIITTSMFTYCLSSKCDFLGLQSPRPSISAWNKTSMHKNVFVCSTLSINTAAFVHFSHKRISGNLSPNLVFIWTDCMVTNRIEG